MLARTASKVAGRSAVRVNSVSGAKAGTASGKTGTGSGVQKTMTARECECGAAPAV